MNPIDLTLAHSPDPDDAFMWWPLTGMFDPQRAEALQGAAYGREPVPAGAMIGAPTLDTGRFRFRALPADIEVLNRRAMEKHDLEITALSLRCWADVRDRYAITACGASFGDGFGPKLVARRGDERINCHNCLKPPDVTIAVPGRRTTAFLMLGMVMGPHVMASTGKFIEMPFDQITGAVARGEADAGLVIHEDQLSFQDRGLRLVLDVGEWWKKRSGLKLPLGVNAVRRDLDRLHGPGTLSQVAALLARSVEHAMSRWDESVRYTMAFASANAARSGGAAPTLERVDRYCHMYVSEETRDMGNLGREAIRRLLAEGSAAGLCPAVSESELEPAS